MYISVDTILIPGFQV